MKEGVKEKEAHKIIRSLLFFITYSTDHDNDSNNCFSSQNVQRIKFEQIWEKQKSFLPFSFFNETKKNKGTWNRRRGWGFSEIVQF